MFSQSYIAEICIPIRVANTMLPCPLKAKEDKENTKGDDGHRRLLWYERRVLAGGQEAKCKEVNMVCLSNLFKQFHSC